MYWIVIYILTQAWNYRIVIEILMHSSDKDLKEPKNYSKNSP